jgi:hypothetical protein
MRKPAPAKRFGLAAFVLTCFLAVSLGGCGSGQVGPTPTATQPQPTATAFTYRLDVDVNRNCRWQNRQPATCQVSITNKADSNSTFTWQASSSPAGATFSPNSGSVAPGATSGLITVISPTTYCPIKFRFVDTQAQFEADSMFNPCSN